MVILFTTDVTLIWFFCVFREILSLQVLVKTNMLHTLPQMLYLCHLLFNFCFNSTLLVGPSPQEKSNCLALVNRESSAIKCTCTLQILVGWLMLKYHGSLFIFMIQMERRLLEFNGNPWNDISFLLAELFWQSGATKVRYMYCSLIFSIYDNTNALVLVVIVHVRSSCYVTPGHELNIKYETLHMVRLQWGYWLYINMYKINDNCSFSFLLYLRVCLC